MKRLLTLSLLGVACARPPSSPLVFRGAYGPVDVPVVRARVNGHDALFAVDSGADLHIVSPTFARSIGLSARASGVDVSIVDVDVVLTGGWAVPQHQMLSFDLTQAGVERNGLAGVLSPQLLAREGNDVVVDVSARTLTTMPTRDRARMTGPLRVDLTACTPNDKIASRNYTVRVLIDDHPFDLKVDTGRATTALFFKQVARALALEERAERLWVRLAMRSTRDDEAEFLGEGWVMLSTDEIEPTDHCKYDGLLGLDVLRHCRLALGVEDGVATCS